MSRYFTGPRAEGLEEVLEHHADLALDPADGLLEHPGEGRIGPLDADRVLKPIVVIEHRPSSSH